MAVDTKKAKPIAVTPPPLSKGRKGSKLPKELLEAMKKTIEEGGFASIDQTFDTKEKATSALSRFRKALAEILGDDVKLTSRVWGENTGADSDGNVIQAAPFHFALADKAKVEAGS